jgi:putative copper resistance protein D
LALLFDIYGFASVLLRGCILTAQALALGGIAFVIWIAEPLAPELGQAGAATLRRCRRLLRACALAAAFAVALGLSAEVAILASTLGEPLLASLSARFALAGLVQVLAALALAGLGRPGAAGGRTVLLLAGLVLLAAAAANSHAAARLEPPGPLLLATALHQLAASAWIGGLPYLLVALATCRGAGTWRRIGRRFSTLAMVGVAALVGSGLALATVYVGSLEALIGTAYGLMVSVKALLLAGLLALGGVNFLALRRARRDPPAPNRRLRSFAEVELGVGITVLFAAASLVSLPPAVDLESDRVTLAEVRERLAPRWPSLESPDPASLGFQQRQAELERRARATGAPAPQAWVPGAGLAPPRNAANIAWSEFNHHWAGVAVLGIGLLALAERTGRAAWARHWPLLFLPLAVFLMVRDDVESGLYGGVGALAILRDPEFVQHRILYLLVAAFGLFEWGVRTGRIRTSGAALVFPILTASAAGFLLAHSHSLSNVKELLLIEITHVPLALLGIAAAWARWLELRLDPRGSRIAAWVWPLCFAGVGVALLLYRES